jgi:transcriptional regulator with XRE-family HTH domain
MSTWWAMAQLIDRALVEEGLTQAQFCRLVGVSQKHLSQVLLGKAPASMPTLDYWAFHLGRHFNVELKRGVKP